VKVAASTRRLAANPALGALVLANGISAIGDWLYLTVIPVLVYRETENPALVGLAAAARLLPWLLLSIPAGIVADRVSRRHLLLLAESCRATLMFLMTGLLLLGAPLWMTFGVALAAVAAGTFAMPAQGTLIPDLARDEGELGIANVLSSTFDNIACIIGPALAGLLIVVGGLEFAFALNGVSFLVVVAVLIVLVRNAGSAPSTVAPSQHEVKPHSEAAAAGWTRIVREAIGPLAMDAAISFAAGATMILPVLLAVGLSGDGGALIGILSTSAGLGGLAGAVGAGAFVNGRPRQGLVVGIVVAVGSLALLAASTAPVIVALGVAIVSAAIVQLDTLNMTELQRSTHSGQLGRTLGLLHTLAAAWVMAGSVVIGILANVVGVGFAILACAVVVAVLGSAALLFPPRASTPAVPSAALLLGAIRSVGSEA
jgi:MFS family permease